MAILLSQSLLGCPTTVLPRHQPAWRRAPLFPVSASSESSHGFCTAKEAGALGKVTGVKLHLFPSLEMSGDL